MGGVTRGSPAKQLQIARLNSGSQTTTSTALEDFSPSLSVSWTGGFRPFYLELVVPLSSHNTALGQLILAIADAANVVVPGGQAITPPQGATASKSWLTAFKTDQIASTPGTAYVYHVRKAIIVAGTGTLTHNAGNPIVLRAVEVEV